MKPTDLSTLDLRKIDLRTIDLRTLDLKAKVSQLFFPRLGSNLHPCIPADEHADAFYALMRDYPIGGLVLFNGYRSTTPRTLAQLQAASRIPLLVAADIERGVGQQLRGAIVFPHALAFDGIAEETLRFIEDASSAIAQEALSLGIHISFSPVADVHSNPDNPIISARAFGSNPGDVPTRSQRSLL